MKGEQGSPTAAYLLRDAIAETGLWETDSTVIGLAPGLRAVQYLKLTYIHVHPRTWTPVLLNRPAVKPAASSTLPERHLNEELQRSAAEHGGAGAALPCPALPGSHRSGSAGGAVGPGL